MLFLKQTYLKPGNVHCNLELLFCVCVAGVGGAGPGGFRDVSRETSDLCRGLGEKLQGFESTREGVRASAQVKNYAQRT